LYTLFTQISPIPYLLNHGKQAVSPRSGQEPKPVVTSFFVIFAFMEPFKRVFSPFDDIFSGRNVRNWVRATPPSAMDQMRSQVMFLITETGREL